MNYFISRCNCAVLGKSEQTVIKGVKYLINDINSSFISCGKNFLPTYICFKTNCGVTNIKAFGNCYYLFNPTKFTNATFFKISSNRKEFIISVSSKLIIMCDNEIILKREVFDLEFCNYEEDNDLLILYFDGLRKFFVVIKSGVVICSSYYDEFNTSKNEKLFMCRLEDCLNHGRVFKLSEGKFEEYVVYLDDLDLKLKPRFVSYAFLDCILAKNHTYCNMLLASDLRQNPTDKVLQFFPEFDYYFEIEENVVVLINKNALAGIYKFEIENDLISNIIQID